MAINLDRFKKDLSSLVETGDWLLNSIQWEACKKEFEKEVESALGEKAAEFYKKLPPFRETYEGWYSEALAMLRQILPDRVANFISLYEKQKGRKEVDYGNYVVQDYMQGLIITAYGEKKVGPDAAIPQFRQQVAIVKAAQRRFDSSLFEIKQLVQADLFDSEIEVARELLKKKFIRAAGAIAGVVLERHLKLVCDDRGIAIPKKNPGISDLNELLKANSVIDVPQWRHISLLGDLRNLCSHNKEQEPTLQQVSDLIDGADKMLRSVA